MAGLERANDLSDDHVVMLSVSRDMSPLSYLALMLRAEVRPTAAWLLR
jgi:hypothetical protein